MKKSWIAAGLLSISLLLLTGCGGEEVVSEQVDEGTAVEVQTVTTGSISTRHQVSGSVVSGTSEQVFVSLSARCNGVSVVLGDSVKKGDVLGTLDLSTFWDSYALAETNYRNAQNTYQDQASLLEKQVEMQQNNYNNVLALFQIGAASQVEVDAAKLNLDAAKVSRDSSLSQLDMAVKNAKLNMDQLNDTLKNVDSSGAVRAPISGTVSSLSLANGGYVSAGMPVAVIDSNNDRKVSIAVSETLVSKLKVGDSTTVNLGALNHNFEGSIMDIAQSASPTNRLYTVNIAIPSTIEGLLSGMFADVTLYTDSRDGTIIIPTEAILVRSEGSYVAVLEEGNLAHLITVETGLVGEGVTEILSGLTGGETLVTVGQSYLSEGDLARIVPAGD